MLTISLTNSWRTYYPFKMIHNCFFVILLSVCCLIVKTSQMCINTTAPAASCLGPFVMRRSLGTPGTCTGPQDEALMATCLSSCATDLCCRAAGLDSGVCVTSNIHTHALDFVKEVNHYLQPYPLIIYLMYVRVLHSI